MTKIKNTDRIKEILNAGGIYPGDITQAKGFIYLRWGFFYTMGNSAYKYAIRVSHALEVAGVKASIVDTYDKWVAFRGGDSIKKGSHFLVKLKIESWGDK
jgi:hypothetical protein